MIYVLAVIGLVALFVVPCVVAEHYSRDETTKFLDKIRKSGRKRK